MYSRVQEIVAAMTPGPDKTVPVFVCHGDSDPLVKYNWAQRTVQAIEDMGWKVDFHTYKYALPFKTQMHS